MENHAEKFIGERIKDILIKGHRERMSKKDWKKIHSRVCIPEARENPGSISVNNEKIKIEAPGMRNKKTLETTSPEIYQRAKKQIRADRRLAAMIINGLIKRKFKIVGRLITDSFGVSQSGISRKSSKRV